MTDDNTLWNIEAGWLVGARRQPSPNCNARPPGQGVELVVIHNISLPPNCFGGEHIEALFTNCLDTRADPYFEALGELRVSAHFLIRRDGEVVQFVDTDVRAWHAGVSSWDGRVNCNDFSVGIELEGADETPYEAVQYDRLTRLLAAIKARYPKVSDDAIVGHSDIAPGRKTDPGPAFDWSRLKRELASLNCEANKNKEVSG